MLLGRDYDSRSTDRQYVVDELTKVLNESCVIPVEFKLMVKSILVVGRWSLLRTRIRL